MEYQAKARCKCLITIHLILVVKYRKQLLRGLVGEFVKTNINEIASASDFVVEEMEIDKDHIHIMITIGTNYSVGQYVRRIKQQTTANVWKNFPSLKYEFWQEKTFWSDGYFACSIGNACVDTIRKYIQEQG